MNIKLIALASLFPLTIAAIPEKLTSGQRLCIRDLKDLLIEKKINIEDKSAQERIKDILSLCCGDKKPYQNPELFLVDFVVSHPAIEETGTSVWQLLLMQQAQHDLLKKNKVMLTKNVAFDMLQFQLQIAERSRQKPQSAKPDPVKNFKKVFVN